MSSRGKDITSWRKSVLTAACKPAVKLCCAYLADHMDAERKVSRPRHLIVRDLGTSPRTVDRMIAGAIRAGLLSLVHRGQKGVTAVYQGTFPDAVTTFSASPVGALKRVRNGALKPVQRANSWRTSSNGSGRGPDGRDERRNDEETEDQTVRSDLLVCDCHGVSDCASLTRSHTSEETA